MLENEPLKCLSFRLDETGKRMIAAVTPEGATDAVVVDALKRAVAAVAASAAACL